MATERLAMLLTANGAQAVSEFQRVGTAATRSLTTAETSSARLRANLTRTGVAFVTMGGLATYGLYRAAQAASDLEEAQNKANVVFGDSVGVVEDFADSSARSFGISETAALDASASFGNMFTAMGVGQGQAAEMSVRMTQLAADMASFNNEDPTAMLERLRAGLAGEVEPLRRFGAEISAARVEQFAFSNGIAEVGTELTNQQKLIARYGLILEDTAVQQGDFARTAGSAANQQRILAASWDDLVAAIGAGALPMLNRVIGLLNSAVGAFQSLNGATDGALGGLMAWGAIGAVAAGGLLLLVSKLMGAQAAFQAFMSTTTGVRLGLLALNPAFQLVGIAVGIAALANFANGLNDVKLNLEGLSNATDEAVTNFATGFENMPDWISESDKLNAFRAAAESNIVAAERFGEAWAAAGGPAGEINSILQETAAHNQAVAAEADGAAAANERLAGGLDNAGGAAANAAAQLENLSQEISQYLGQVQGVEESRDALQSAFQAQYEALVRNGPAWRGDTAAARENRSAAREVVSAHAQLIQRLRETGAGQRQLASATSGTIARLREARDAGLITGNQFRELSSRVREVPGSVNINVTSNVGGTLTAFQQLPPAIRAAAAAADAAQANAAAARSAASQGSAHGGFVREGESTMVHAGERVSVRHGRAVVTPAAGVVAGGGDGGGGGVDERRLARLIAQELALAGIGT